MKQKNHIYDDITENVILWSISFIKGIMFNEHPDHKELDFLNYNIPFDEVDYNFIIGTHDIETFNLSKTDF